jgi:hypothetical protein
MSPKDRLKALADAFNTKNSGNNSNQVASWKKFYQFWKMADDTTATVRFLPDREEDANPLKFLIENLTHELVVDGQRKKVPCLKMYGESCPVCELSSKYYDAGDQNLGKKYYVKRSYIGQVLVIDSPFEYRDEKSEDESLIKYIDFGPKIFKCIQSAFKSGDLEDEPQSFKGGYNFRIKKTKAGQYSDYGTSNFAPKQTDLDDDVIALIKPELKVLSELREKYINRATLEAMILADQTGQQMNDAKDSKDSDSSDSNQSTPAEKNESSTSVQSSGDGSSDDDAASNKARSVLDQLRARAAAKKAESGE